MTKKILHLYSDKAMFWFLIVASIALCVFYFYCINVTVQNIVMRQSVSNDLAHIRTEIGDLEFAYIKYQGNIDRDLAEQLGFNEVRNAEYITRPSLGQHSGTNNSFNTLR